MWQRFLTDLRKLDFNVDRLFDNQELAKFQDGDFYPLLYKSESYHGWLFYISLIIKDRCPAGSYINYVLRRTKGIEEFKQGILNSIIDIHHTDPNYQRFYRERKNVLQQYPDAVIATFITDNKRNLEESIYKLTDNTSIEKKEIISWISSHKKIPDHLDKIYPELSDYLASYSFNDANLDKGIAQRITTYFQNYKRQKLFNQLTDEHQAEVEKLSHERIYNRLPARDELVKTKNDGSTQLFWVDALGVEYIGYIIKHAEKNALNVTIETGRAELPTITSKNNAFFNSWPDGSKHPKEDRLDDVKHEASNEDYARRLESPVHLAKELDIITDVMDTITTTLSQKTWERVVLTSDHGASRLAVLCNKEEKYEADTKGEHSGRCCKYFPDCDLPFAIKDEDAGYIILADYGRFKGGRMANVEVHGGASLEEVLVPVMTFSLKDNDLNIEIIDKTKMKADPQTGVTIKFYINKTIRDPLIVYYSNKRHEAHKENDDNHYSVEIPEITKAGTYSLDIYLDNKRVKTTEIKVGSKSASLNDEFDAFFK